VKFGKGTEDLLGFCCAKLAVQRDSLLPLTGSAPASRTSSRGNGGTFIVNVGYSDEEYAGGSGYDEPFGLDTHTDTIGSEVGLAEVLEPGNYVSWDLTS
jgi:hypothetical protein